MADVTEAGDGPPADGPAPDGEADDRASGDVGEYRLDVRRSARYYTLGRPGPRTREVWVVLHGYRQLARRFLARLHALDDGERWIAAPEALSRFYVEERVGRHGPGSLVGASWMTREDRDAEIGDYVAYLDAVGESLFSRVERGAVHLVLLGFSQGVATAARWATRGAWRPDTLVAWGDTLPPDLDEALARERLGALELVVVCGEGDPSRRPEAEAADEARLSAWGIAPLRITHPGGHGVQEGALLELAGSLRTRR